MLNLFLSYTSINDRRASPPETTYLLESVKIRHQGFHNTEDNSMTEGDKRPRQQEQEQVRIGPKGKETRKKEKHNH